MRTIATTLVAITLIAHIDIKPDLLPCYIVIVLFILWSYHCRIVINTKRRLSISLIIASILTLIGLLVYILI